MIEGLKIFKEKFCKNLSQKPQDSEKRQIVKDFMFKLTQDNGILKWGFWRVFEELQEEKSKNG